MRGRPASVCDRVARVKSSNRNRSTTVRPTRPAARIRRVTRSTSPTSAASMASARLSRDRPRARCDPIERRRRPTVHRAGGRGCARARAGGGPTPGRASRPARPRRRPATSPTVMIPRSWSLPAVTGPTPHSRSTGSGWRNVPARVGRHHQQTVGLGDPARHLGEELGARHADRDRQTDPRRARRAAAASAISVGVPETPPQTRRRRGTPRRSTAPRRAASCRRTPRRPPCSPRSRPTSAARPRRPAGTAGAPACPPIAVRTPYAFAS